MNSKSGRFIVSQNVKTYREEKHMNMNTLAKKSGVAYDRIYKLENSDANITVDSLEKIAKALDKELYELFI